MEKYPSLFVINFLLSPLLYSAQPAPDNWFQKDLQDMQRQAARLAWKNPSTPIDKLAHQAMFSEINIVQELGSNSVDIDNTVNQAFRELEDIVKKYDEAGYGLLDTFKPQQAQDLLNPHAQFSLMRKLESIYAFIEAHPRSSNYGKWGKTLTGQIGYINRAIESLGPKLRYWQRAQSRR